MRRNYRLKEKVRVKRHGNMDGALKFNVEKKIINIYEALTNIKGKTVELRRTA